MSTPKKCIIDNWSLEHAGLLLESSNDIGKSKIDSLVNNLGGLSNFINAILLYKDSFYIMNGFEHHWKRFNWFDTNTSAYIKGVQLDELPINWTSRAAYKDKGIHNYLLTSNYFESDLIISPERSEEIAANNKRINNSFVEALKLIDNKILYEKDNSAFSKIKIGIDHNFQVPSLTQYVLSEASSREDLLTVIMQLKTDGKIEKIVKEIEERTSTAKGAGKFENDIEQLIKKAFGRKIANDNSPSLTVSAYFLSVSKSINLDFFRRKEHFVFLKKLIACRTEAFKIEKDFQRIFKRQLKA